MPKIFAAAGLDLNKNQFVLGVNGDQVELTADLFVFQSGRRAPIPLQNPVAIRLQDAGGQFLAPSADAVGAGWGSVDSESVGCVLGCGVGCYSGCCHGSLPVDSGSASTVPAARVPERG